MSQLLVTSRGLGTTWALNCTAFSAPIACTIVSVQTQTLAQHYPIKVNQPEAEFDVVFANEPDFQAFQRFVRASQLQAQANANNPGVILNWPQRDIRNWTGTVKTFVAGGARANPTPHAKLTVSLLSGMVATTTNVASRVTTWMTIFGYGMPDGVLSPPGTQGLMQDLLGALGTNAGTLNSFAGAVTGGVGGTLASILGGGLGIGGR